MKEALPKVVETTTGQPSSDGRRTLPEDYTESEALIRRFRPYGRMIVEAADGVIVYGKTKALTKNEREDGETAFASLMYEEGMMLSARMLVLLWCITVFTSRILEFIDNRKKEAEESRKRPPLQAAPR